jgi:hypothetical protein
MAHATDGRHYFRRASIATPGTRQIGSPRPIFLLAPPFLLIGKEKVDDIRDCASALLRIPLRRRTPALTRDATSLWDLAKEKVMTPETARPRSFAFH